MPDEEIIRVDAERIGRAALHVAEYRPNHRGHLIIAVDTPARGTAQEETFLALARSGVALRIGKGGYAPPAAVDAARDLIPAKVSSASNLHL